MAIKLRNIKQNKLDAFQIGNATVAYIGHFIAPYAGKILSVSAAVKTAGTVSGTQVFDVDINGTSIWTTTGNRPTIAVGATASTQLAIDGIKTFSKGDLISVEIVSVHGTLAVDSACQVIIERQESALSDFIQL